MFMFLCGFAIGLIIGGSLGALVMAMIAGGTRSDK